MTFSPLDGIRDCWILLAIFWLAGMLFTKPVRRAQTSAARSAHILIALVGGVLMSGYFFRGTWFDMPILPPNRSMQLAGFFITVAGCLFAAVARLTLGANWSGRATVKENHELIRTGPYALARHPIYTGFLLALVGSLIAVPRWCGVAGFFVVIAALVLKMTQEERLMMQTFPQAYPEYRKRVKAIIPGII